MVLLTLPATEVLDLPRPSLGRPLPMVVVVVAVHEALSVERSAPVAPVEAVQATMDRRARAPQARPILEAVVEAVVTMARTFVVEEQEAPASSLFAT